MVSEEMEMNDYLAERGIECLESDMGEYIVQLDNVGDDALLLIFKNVRALRFLLKSVFKRWARVVKNIVQQAQVTIEFPKTRHQLVGERKIPVRNRRDRSMLCLFSCTRTGDGDEHALIRRRRGRGGRGGRRGDRLVDQADDFGGRGRGAERTRSGL